MGASRPIVSRQGPEAILVSENEGRNRTEIAGQVLCLGAVDEFLSLQHPSQQQTDDDEHDGDLDQRKTEWCFSWVSHVAPAS
jgi:hypothetical protein